MLVNYGDLCTSSKIVTGPMQCCNYCVHVYMYGVPVHEAEIFITDTFHMT